MKIEIEIPKEFEEDYQHGRFRSFFLRVLTDIESNRVELCGNYEKETAEMFVKAFQNSIEKK